ncbi:hypothetical protein V5O48_005449 [Marasmius crinis-equi]|uniref:Uncharacterized protein n=1 Tax=Marasmius crinis-equi TaxID=585013 RepID=A0ABR3FMN8_9AGAR
MSITSPTPSSTTSRRGGVTRKRTSLSGILACFTLSTTLDMYDYSMLQSQMSDTPNPNPHPHPNKNQTSTSNDEELASSDAIPLRKMKGGKYTVRRKLPKEKEAEDSESVEPVETTSKFVSRPPIVAHSSYDNLEFAVSEGLGVSAQV